MIDNCPVRPQIENLKSIKLFFLPPNTNSQTQPRDQGIICSMKSQYHKNVERKVILSVKKKESSPWISLLLGMQMLVAAWDAVTTKSVVNFFRKSKHREEARKPPELKTVILSRNWKKRLREFMFNLTGSCLREHGCSCLYLILKVMQKL